MNCELDTDGQAGSTPALQHALEVAEKAGEDFQAVRESAPTHDGHGRFTKGNKANFGKPRSCQAKKAAQLRAVVAASVTAKDMQEVLLALMHKAKRGHLPAIVEFFNRTLGKPLEADVVERLEELEALAKRAANGQELEPKGDDAGVAAATSPPPQGTQEVPQVSEVSTQPKQ